YLLTQDREILPKSTPVHLVPNSVMHAIICYTSGDAPVHSERTAKRRTSPTERGLQVKVVGAFAAANDWPNSLECLYSFELIISTASAEVQTGTISKSAKSRQFAIHSSNRAKSSVCMSCQQILKSKPIQLEMYSNLSGIIRPFSRKRR